jgi:outer membrane lipoprotein carrier protein
MLVLSLLFFIIFSLQQMSGLPILVQDLWAGDELATHIKKLEQRYESMQDFHANFIQQTHLSSVKRAEKGEGDVYFKKGGKMFWAYKLPSVQKFYLDGKQLWVYLPEENQVIKNDVSQLPSDITAGLFSGKLDLQVTFEVSLATIATQAKEDKVVLELIPRQERPSLKKAMLWIDPLTYYIHKTAIEDIFGNITEIEFLAIQINQGIDDAIFEFTPPPGVEIFEPPPLSS